MTQVWEDSSKHKAETKAKKDYQENPFKMYSGTSPALKMKIRGKAESVKKAPAPVKEAKQATRTEKPKAVHSPSLGAGREMKTSISMVNSILVAMSKRNARGSRLLSTHAKVLAH